MTAGRSGSRLEEQGLRRDLPTASPARRLREPPAPAVITGGPGPAPAFTTVGPGGRASRQPVKGFTLIEMMIVVSLLGIFFGGVYETVIVGLRAVSAADKRENLRRQLTMAMDQLTREIDAAYNVDVAQDQRLQFDARDINGDGSNDNNINYLVSSGDFQRVFSGDTITLIPDLASLDFDYIDFNGNTLATPVPVVQEDDVRVVQITMTATRDTETVSLTGAACLRNM